VCHFGRNLVSVIVVVESEIFRQLFVVRLLSGHEGWHLGQGLGMKAGAGCGVGHRIQVAHGPPSLTASCSSLLALGLLCIIIFIVRDQIDQTIHVVFVFLVGTRYPTNLRQGRLVRCF
jgi:hypothetical protein